MAPQIFVTGITGYVGGQVTQNIIAQHPDFVVTGLVRTQEQVGKIEARWPQVRTVLGSLDSRDVLIREAAKSDVVLNLADADHTESAVSLIQGLAQGARNGVYIHLSGAASIIDFSTGFGEASVRVWSDISDLAEVTSFPATALHAMTEQAVIGEGKVHSIRTAILSAANIFGEGEGPIKTKSIQLPWIVAAFLKRGRAFTIGEGKNIVSCVHVKDLGDAFVFLVEESQKENTATNWGADGFYYVESGQFSWAELVSSIAEEGVKHSVLKNNVEQISAEDATLIHPWATLIWGSNCRIKGERLPKLGWKPNRKSVFDTITELIPM